MKPKDNFITITPNQISWGFHAHFIEEEDGMYSWYIPSLDIYFSSISRQQGDEIARDITRSFFNFWLQKQGFRKFLMRVLRLGYKPSSHKELQELLNRTNLNANLTGSTRSLPREFIGAGSSQQVGDLATAV
jgi:hypothetical protein